MPDPGIARAARLRLTAGILCLVLAAAAAGYRLLRPGGASAPETRTAMRAAVPTAIPASSAVDAATTSAADAATAVPLPVVVVPTPPRARRSATEAEVVAQVEAGAAAPRPAASGASATHQASPAPATATSSGSEPAAPAAPPPPRPAAPRSRTYSGSITLAGGEKIELGGIAWSEEEPRALLNDRIVGVGGYVDGYAVSKIETDRVVLEKDGATIVLTVK
jgi:hypothetical protein